MRNRAPPPHGPLVGAANAANAANAARVPLRASRILHATSGLDTACARVTTGRTTGHPAVVGLTLDLASLADVRRFADTFSRLHSRLDLAILNAGSFGPASGLITTDGFEQTFQARGRTRHIERVAVAS